MPGRGDDRPAPRRPGCTACRRSPAGDAAAAAGARPDGDELDLSTTRPLLHGGAFLTPPRPRRRTGRRAVPCSPAPDPDRPELPDRPATVGLGVEVFADEPLRHPRAVARRGRAARRRGRDPRRRTADAVAERGGLRRRGGERIGRPAPRPEALRVPGLPAARAAAVLRDGRDGGCLGARLPRPDAAGRRRLRERRTRTDRRGCCSTGATRPSRRVQEHYFDDAAADRARLARTTCSTSTAGRIWTWSTTSPSSATAHPAAGRRGRAAVAPAQHQLALPLPRRRGVLRAPGRAAPGPAGHRVPGQQRHRGGRPGAAAGAGPTTGRRDVVAVREAYHGWTDATDAVSTSVADNPQRPRHPAAAGCTRSTRRTASAARTAAPRPTGTRDGRGRRHRADRGRPPARASWPRRSTATPAAWRCPDGYLAQVYAAVRRGRRAVHRRRGAGRLRPARRALLGLRAAGRGAGRRHGRQGDGQRAPARARSSPPGRSPTATAAQGYFFSSAGGSPVSCVVGLAVLDVLRDEGLQENARVRRRPPARPAAARSPTGTRSSARCTASASTSASSWCATGRPSSRPPRRPRRSASGCGSWASSCSRPRDRHVRAEDQAAAVHRRRATPTSSPTRSTGC